MAQKEPAKDNTVFCACGKPSIALGDFNLPDLMLSNQRGTFKSFRDALKAHVFDQLVPRPTRGSSFLDLMFCNKKGLVKRARISPPIGDNNHSTALFKIQLKADPGNSGAQRWV